MNQGELDLFHAVVEDLKDGKHPGNRIRVPLIRQATIMKRNRAGFFNIRHAVCSREANAALRDAFECSMSVPRGLVCHSQLHMVLQIHWQKPGIQSWLVLHRKVIMH